MIKAFIDSDNEISFIDCGGYESRSESTIILFKEAFDQIKDKLQLKITRFYVNTDDLSAKINNTLTFGYTNSNDTVLCPDFTFDRWVECGIDTYEKTVTRIIDSGNEKYVIEKLFWIGNVNTQPLRYKLLELGAEFMDKMEIIAMDWKRILPKGYKHGFTEFVSLEDHTKYKYLIDCGARGFSGRLKFLLFTNRPLFLVNRDKNKQEYFYSQLIPFKHYIPVKEDLSDLITQFEWAEENYDDAITIANNARQFAIEYLNKKTVIDYLSRQLMNSLS